MPRKRRYELLLVIEATNSEAGQRAANAAWYAADRTPGCAVVNETVRERLRDGGLKDTTWREWQGEGGPSMSVGYPDMPT